MNCGTLPVRSTTNSPTGSACAYRRLQRSGHSHRYRELEGKIANDARRSAAAQGESAPRDTAQAGPEPRLPPVVGSAPADRGLAWPGHPVAEADLYDAGFRPLDLKVTSLDVHLPNGLGCEWTTVGEVPDTPGLYAFTVEDEHDIRVAYVGRTGHLWMVCEGRLPRGGGARGGQRYGRPRHAGLTRQRVNVLIAQQLRSGRVVRHWVRPLTPAALGTEEERLITTWNLRRVGWNRG